MEWLFEKWNVRACIALIWLRIGTKVASSYELGKAHLNISELTAFLLVKSCRRFGAACVHRQGRRVQATSEHRRWRPWGRARNCEFSLMPYGLWYCVVSYVTTLCSEAEGRIFLRNARTTYEATRCHKQCSTKFVIASFLSINLQLLGVKENIRSDEKYKLGSAVNWVTGDVDESVHRDIIMKATNKMQLYRLTLRLLMSYIYGAPILDVSRSHTTTHHSR